MGFCWFLQCLLILITMTTCVYGLGVNWGTAASHKLPPTKVVKMLEENGIKKVKLFDSDPAIMNALANTGIEVIIGIPNADLLNMTDRRSARRWVNENVVKYHHEKSVNIKYVAVGNEPFLKAYNGTYIYVTFTALKNIQHALNKAGLGNTTKATIPLYADIYEYPSDQRYPSAGRFRKDIRHIMEQILELLDKNGAPFLASIHPFRRHGHLRFPLNYAFFDGKTEPIFDKVTNISYTNAFDADFDSLVSALKDVGYGNMTIIVGEIGWPTDGDKDANIHNAQRFYRGLLPRLAVNKGTPLRSGYIEVYLIGLIDEDRRGVACGNYQRHWGLFRYDGQPKFPIDLSGKNQNKYLEGAENVDYLPSHWCILNPEVTDMGKVEREMEYICLFTDCTAIQDGGSCSSLSLKDKASYAFNMLYQTENQNLNACPLDGLALLTTQNISLNNCNFTIQIVDSPAAPGSSPMSLAFVTLVLMVLLL